MTVGKYLVLLLLNAGVTFGQALRLDTKPVADAVYYYTDDFGYYQVTGKVKRITASVTRYPAPESRLFNRGPYTNGNVVDFTVDGQPETLTSISRIGSDFIADRFFYDENKRLIRKEECHPNGFLYAEKYLYDNDKRIETWVRSDHQIDFFLRQRSTYDTLRRLVKSEYYNHDENTDAYVQCKGGYRDADFIHYSYYNENGECIKRERLKYEYHARFSGLPPEVWFMREHETINRYKDGMLVKRFSSDVFDSGYPPRQWTTEYRYNKAKHLVLEKEYHKKRGFNPFKRLLYKKGKLHKVKRGYRNHITYIDYYDENENLIKTESFKKRKVIDTRKYDANGFMIYHQSKEDLWKCHIIYDDQGNWIKSTAYENGILSEEKQRTIEYYD